MTLEEKIEELGTLIYELREYTEEDMDYIIGRVEEAYEEVLKKIGEKNEQ